MTVLENIKVAILGYGNQGRAHALNLRDSGIEVVVGAREGKGRDAALQDGFQVMALTEAAKMCSVVMFLLPDQTIPEVYAQVAGELKGKSVGFAHGFAYHFGLIQKDPSVHYFLAGPKGAGAILREKYISGEGLPGVYAVGDDLPETESVALAYAKAVGIANQVLIKTTFQEETECDLFGEQAVLCGSFFKIMEGAFSTLVKNGHTPEMAFFETCYEARLILELWMKYGPHGVTERISPTAFYGGLTRGQEMVDESFEAKFQSIFDRIRSGDFAREWMKEVSQGMPKLNAERTRQKNSELNKVYNVLAQKLH